MSLVSTSVDRGRDRRTIAVIINPISGGRGRPDVARRRAEQAAAVIASASRASLVSVTERAGHAHDLARAAVAGGADVVVAWGGDGTVNEVASALARTPAALAIVPGGSGNGLARELGVPWDPAHALRLALGTSSRVIDAGELDGRLFVNVAGIGLDARVAHGFAGSTRRGLRRYAEVTLRELRRYVPVPYVVTLDEAPPFETVPLLIAIANSRQYGNGAIIAPAARIDDGRLDVVVVEHRSPLAVLWQMPRLFLGQVERLPGVRVGTSQQVRVSALEPIPCHVDGEPFLGSATVSARVLPGVLRVMVAEG